tara:strand:- start:1353 stop:1769 length:417 start_codon:yes stop_codon:yes gene_type:complete
MEIEVIPILTFIYLFLFSIYHVFTGVISVFFSEYSLKFYKKIYGHQPKETKQLIMTFKPWGTMAIGIGFAGIIILFNLKKYSLLLIAFIAILGIRAGYRFLLRNELYNYWKVKPLQNWRMILIQLIGVLVFLSYLIYS